LTSEKYQGKEFRTHLQANSEEDLNEMIAGLHAYALEYGLDPPRILQRGPDPDGGFEASISSHNKNPIDWIREKFRGRGGEKAYEEDDVILLPERAGYSSYGYESRSDTPEMQERQRIWKDLQEKLRTKKGEEEPKEDPRRRKTEREQAGSRDFLGFGSRFGKWKEERTEEQEFKKKQEAGEVDWQAESPKEKREQEETAIKARKEGIEAAKKARAAERRSRPKEMAEHIKAREEAFKAEERAKILETELEGGPIQGIMYAVTKDPETGQVTTRRRLPKSGEYILDKGEEVEYGPPVQVLRDKWGRELGEIPLRGKRRETSAQLQLTELGLREKQGKLLEAKLEEAEESIRLKKRERKAKQILGPVKGTVRGVMGGVMTTVAGVGSVAGGVRVDPRPYRTEKPKLTPDRPRMPIGPKADPSKLFPSPRRIQPSESTPGRSPIPRMPTPSLPKMSLFPQAPKPPIQRKKGRQSTHGDQMRRMRRKLF